MSSTDPELVTLATEPEAPATEPALPVLPTELIPLLEPISGSNPCGPDLYRNEFDVKIRQIKHESPSPQKADEQSIKYAIEFLTQKSKDLRAASELASQLGTSQGLKGMMAGMELMFALTEKYWDGIHRLGDFDEPPAARYELRAGAFERLDSADNMPRIVLQHVFAGKLSLGARIRAGVLDNRINQTRLDQTISDKEGIIDTYLTEAKERGEQTLDEMITEQEHFAENSRDLLLSQLKLVNSISSRLREIDISLARPERFDRKYGFFPKTMTKLAELEEWIGSLIQADSTEEDEAEADAEASAEEPESTAETSVEQRTTANETPNARPARRAAKQSSSSPLTDIDTARARIVEAAQFWRGEHPDDPTPYLLLRAMRMGEAFRNDSGVLPAPGREDRLALKQSLEAEDDWAEVSRCVESVMAKPDGCGWLDAHRAGILALEQLKRPEAAAASKALLAGWLGAKPEWQTASLDDDTPAAGEETRRFLAELVGGNRSAETPKPPEPLPIPAQVFEVSPEASTRDQEIEALVASGQCRQAIARLAAEARVAQTGRERFLLRLRQAELCHGEGHAAVADSILDDLARQIDFHHLDTWESSELSARTLATLYLSLRNRDPVRARTAYQRLCQLDVDTALSLGPPPE